MSYRVSVIIPVFNGQAYLGDSLRSIATQSFSDLEIIVVDDGSTDSTFEVTQAFGDRRLRYIRQDRAGAAAARNRGVELANGPLLAFLDADDVWIGQKLCLQIASLRRGDGDMIFANVEEFITPDRLDELENHIKLRSGPRPFIYASTLLMRRADFQKVGPFDIGWRVGEFIAWYARAKDLGLRSAVLPQVLTRRRIHDVNTGRLERNYRTHYARVMKSVLDRRRVGL